MAGADFRRRLTKLEAAAGEARREAAATWGSAEEALHGLGLDQLRQLVALGRLDEEAGAEFLARPENSALAEWLVEQVKAERAPR